jgi:O-acetyl-ADP-ribose deacetylase (regulator of RNase III)
MAYGLPSEIVIHTVAPIYKDLGALVAPQYLESCYTQCMAACSNYDCESIAFPAIGTGIYGYPLEAAAIVGIKTVGTMGRIDPSYKDVTVKFVCYDEAAFLVYHRVLNAFLLDWKYYATI